MNLHYELTGRQLEAVALTEGETVWYCVPVDLQAGVQTGDNRYFVPQRFAPKELRLVVTEKRLLFVGEDMIVKQYMLEDYEEVRAETQVGCGILVLKSRESGEKLCAGRFSLRHIVRVSYVARGADILAKGERERVKSLEYEKYCDKCGRALPGTASCPYCSGKSTMLKKFMLLCGGYGKRVALISVLMTIVAALAILMPVVQQRFIDNTLKSADGTMQDVYRFMLTMLAITAVMLVCDTWKYWLCVSMGATLSMDLRSKLYHKVQILSLSFINKRKPGELMNRVSGDTSRVRQFMEEVFGSMVGVLFEMVAAFVMMLAISWRMTLISSVMIIVVIVVTKLFWRRIHRIFHRQWLKQDAMHSGLQDIISGMRVVKAFGQEEAEAEKYRGLTDEFCKVQKKNEVFWAIFYPILNFIMGMGIYLVIFLGGSEVLNGTMTDGQLVQFMTYAGYLYGPMSWMTGLPRYILQLITSLNRIYDVLDEEPAIKEREQAKQFEIAGAVAFRDISFGYDSYQPVLEHVNFSVKPGEMIGLVGASGTGKSTLINLLMRLYDVDRGQITIDGTDIRDIGQSCLHSQIGVVLQETFLFSGTILNNIRFAKQDATYEEVIQAAKAANAHDFICKTPDGYQTYVGEHGYNLSGGERQRIAIARAILNDPRLLILDEATSALDMESEFLIQQALERLIKGRTTFAIAHRLATLRNADRLVVIDGHRVAEIGTHNELLEKKGIYYGLVQAQLNMSNK